MGINSIKVKRVIRTLDLGDYQEEYSGTSIDVWVNPPMKITQQVGDLLFSWQKASARRLLLEKPERTPQNSEDISTGDSTDEVETGSMRTGSPEEIKKAKAEELAGKRAYYGWFAQVWEDSNADEVWDLVEKLENEEPAMLIFLRERTLRMIQEYTQARKKA